ncbi:ATP-dependent zinc metalloprotease FtsH [Halosquirtibacter laminarini]|uniref:ATP-dependent zinc metalloprotease FtsH n=1 Tax=Halosquirtibacter laminarini TaxID=3374600 RepID=A0AC61NJJ2_9BACT|nr:ATP-dependent zinc metalloprotease FtsH [Prolixibacteraceae bacterium]
MAKDSNKKGWNMPKQGKPGSNGKGGLSQKFNPFIFFLIITLLFVAFQFFAGGSGAIEKNWNEIRPMFVNRDVEKVVVINKDRAEYYLKADKLKKYESDLKGTFSKPSPEGPQFYSQIGDVTVFSQQLDRAQKNIPEVDRVIPSYNTRTDSMGIFFNILPILVIIFIWFYLFRRMGKGGAGGGAGGIFNVGKSQAKVIEKGEKVDTTFKDVAGLSEAKQEIEEIVDFLKMPEKYTKLGGKIPRGALLVGPPGTGKTLLAKAVAGEAGVPFFSMSGSDFVEMFVGVGASRVRDLFKQAKEKSPCIIFIDEIDAIGRARGKNGGFSSNDERENTLNQLLTEMDGFGTNSGVIILAATNRADILDRALMRAGRFDRQIHVDLPDLNDRKAIFKVHLRPLKISEDFDSDFLAKQTPGFSGADIANVCNEAALYAARKKKDFIEKQDFLDAVDRIVGGLEKKNKILTPLEKKTIAFHEAGHASVSWLLEHAHPLVKVTIVPRGYALGAAWYLPEERQITTKEQLLDEMCATLGGRAAEEIIFGRISTGAQNDLEKVTKLAYSMISVYGMSDKVGNVSFYDSSGRQDYGFSKPYSDETAVMIDHEVRNLIQESYERAKDIIRSNQEGFEELANTLLTSEVIFSDDVEKIFGARPWKSKTDELEDAYNADHKAEEMKNTSENIEKDEEDLNEQTTV